MNPQIDLKRVERRTFKTTFQDGLVDLYLGLLLLAGALGALSERAGLDEAWNPFVGVGYALLITIGFRIVRQFVILPRRGIVQFSPARRQRMNRLYWITLGGVLLIEAGLVIVGLTGIWHSPYVVHIAVSLIIVTVTGIYGYYAHFYRLYGYGLILLLAYVAKSWWDDTLTRQLVVWGVPAGVMIAVGGWLFVRFLRGYPLPRVGEMEALNHDA
jgi:hypothetical protein